VLSIGYWVLTGGRSSRVQRGEEVGIFTQRRVNGGSNYDSLKGGHIHPEAGKRRE